jgi:uncharacterized protein YkwD
MKIWLATLLMLFAGFFTPAQAGHLTNNDYERAVLVEINQVRSSHGLSRVNLGECVDDSAERYANKIDNGVLIHSDLDFLNRCGGTRAGEVLAVGFHRPAKVVDAWMDSPGHRDVLMAGAYDSIGIGVVKTPLGPLTVAQFLAK